MNMEKRYLGIEELSQYLGLTKGTLYVWVCQRRIPYLKVGKLVKFDIIEVVLTDLGAGGGQKRMVK